MRALRRLSRASFFAVLAAAPAARAAFEDLGVSARGAGMGHVQTALADDPYASFYNPAGLASLETPQLVSSYGRLFLGLEDRSGLQNSHVAYAHPFGERGGLGLSWNYFSLDSLYQEHTLTGAFGRRVLEGRLDGFYAGGALKILSRSLNPGSLAARPLDANGAVAVGRSDPVLAGASRANWDLDLGALWRISDHVSAGARVAHLFQPDVAFSDSDEDRLRRGVDLGLAFRTPWSAVALDLRHRPSPTGSRDNAVALAAEKWLPTLLRGEFGVRASLAFGTRELRQLTAGLSYRIHRMQFDYGWTMPLGSVGSTLGAHRVGLSLRFGRPAEEGRLNEAILESMRSLSESPGLEYRYRIGEVAVYQNRAIQDLMRSAHGYLEAGRVEEARRKAADASSLSPLDADLREKRARLERLSAAFPRLEAANRDPFESAALFGALAYYYGRATEALEKFRYAQKLRPSEDRLLPFLRELESAAPKAPEPPKRDLSEESRRALEEGRYEEAVGLCRRILEAEPANVGAHLRIGLARSRQRRYAEAAAALEEALRHEPSEDVRKAIKANLEAVRRSAEAAPPPPAPAAKPVGIERLYEKGVEAYARGSLEEALEAFRRILGVDPGNDAAKKAIQRIEAERKPSQ